jgi:hypothetical protein
VVEHFLGKEEVVSSILINGSENRAVKNEIAVPEGRIGNINLNL